MLQITAGAAAHLVSKRQARGLDASWGARFVRGKAGVGLAFSRAPRSGDTVLAGYPLPIYVAEEMAKILDRAVVDQARHDPASGLVVRPQVTA